MGYRVGQLWRVRNSELRLRVIRVGSPGHMRYRVETHDIPERTGYEDDYDYPAEVLSKYCYLDEADIVTTVLSLYGI